MGARLWPAIAAQLGLIGTLLIGSLGIFVALRNQRRQLNAQMFIEFSNRFQQLLRTFPKNAWLANHTASLPLPPSSPELTECAIYCIHFVADVYYLHRGGYVSAKLWRLWEREIKRTLTGPVFQRELAAVEIEFSQDSEFLAYLRSLMRDRGCDQTSSAMAPDFETGRP
jgi:hypothetical protein